MPTPMEDKRIDRFDTEAISDKEITITRRDDVRFEAMSSYDYLDAEYIAALTGGNAASITNRFLDLKRKPHSWVKIADPMTQNRRIKQEYRFTSLAYSLTQKAKNRLISNGFTARSHGCNGPFVHKLMASWVRASFDIAERIEKAPIEIIPFYKILQHPDNERTAKSEKPHAFNVRYTYNGEPVEKEMFFDCYPFAIHTKKEGYALLLYENDCDTSSIEPKIEQKFLGCIDIIERNLHYKRYSFDKVYFLFVTTNETHKSKMMERLEVMTLNKPWLREYFLFKRHPSLNSDDKPIATGHMATEPWDRVDLPPLSFI
jgi:hypothetical protein